MYNSNVIGIFFARWDKEIHEANDEFLRIVDYSRQELKSGKIKWDKLTPKVYRPKDKIAIKQLLRYGTTTPWEKDFIRKDGMQIPVIIGSALLNKNTGENIVFVLDITERKKLEQRKDEFIALASHELKTPVTSLKMYTQILQQRLKKAGTKDAEMFMVKMDGQLNKLTKIIGDLLDISRVQAGKLEYKKEIFPVNDLIAEITSNIQRTADGHKIYIKGQTNQKIKADRDRIGQVLINLINNAIKFSPKSKKILLGSSLENDNVKIYVRDFGIGIPKELQPKIFDRFYQASSSEGRTYPGLGLGLYISKEITERHGGQISIESKPGIGSIFYVTLPVDADNREIQ